MKQYTVTLTDDQVATLETTNNNLQSHVNAMIKGIVARREYNARKNATTKLLCQRIAAIERKAVEMGMDLEELAAD
jgi:hypothetical protein